MKKAQIQFDYMVAFFLFLIVIFFSALIALQPISKSDENLKETKILETSNRLSELLIKTKGLPEDWENDPNNVERIGLASEPWVLNSNKITALNSLNYSKVREALGIETYQMLLIIRSDTTSITIGNKPNMKDSISTIKRYTVLDGNITTVIISIW